MLKHYLKISLRNLSRQKGLTFINVFGLSIGLACFILFLLYALNEFSFDRFHKDNENIYRVYLNIDPVKGQERQATTHHPIPLGPAIKQDIPEVKNYVRIKEERVEDNFIRVDNKVIRAGITFADPSFFSVFSFPLINGEASFALAKKNNIVLTREKAMQLFGTTNVIGKLVEVKLEKTFDPFIVSGVVDNIPANSSISFSFLISFDQFISTRSGKRAADNWGQSGYQTYVQLQPGSLPAGTIEKLAGIRRKYYKDEGDALRKSGDWDGRSKFPITYRLEPLREIHTTVDISGGSVGPVNPKSIWILLAIAACVLLIACINFTTLSIGRSAGRAKEIGIRKVIGSNKRQVIFQFLSEALFLSILSGVSGVILSRLLLPYFNQLSGRDISFSFSRYPEMVWMLAALIVIVGLLAGSYPSLILSNFKPVEVLKSKIRVGGSNLFTRSLVTVQFVVSIGLITSTVIILQQLSFLKTKNPGFNKENVVMIDAEGTSTRKIFPLFKQALAKEPSIQAVAGADMGIGEGTGWSSTGWDYEGKHREVYEYYIDNNYLDLLGVQVLAGRKFDPNIGSDTLTSVIINEAMMNDFGWTLQNAVGQQLKGYSETVTPVVIGVTKNINFLSMTEKVAPQLFHRFHAYAPYKYLVRIQPGNPATALAAIEKGWKSVEPILPLKFDFMDDSINNFYKAEQRWNSIVGWAGGISIFLACMGLFGLAALASINRTKEVAIRKVMGASVSRIIGLLSKDFLQLVLIASVIAAPITWYFMHQWLQDFAYRISIGWIAFIVTGIVAILIAFITISFQTVKAAGTNPVKSLRAE